MKALTPFQIAAIALCLAVATTARAQRQESSSQVVPPNLRPPAGMCRIWVEGVPPERQPAPTDCASALRNRPPKGRVIFGDDYAAEHSDRTGAEDRSLKGVAPLPKSLEPKPADAKRPTADSGAAKKKGGPRTTRERKVDSSGVARANAPHGGGGPI